MKDLSPKKWAYFARYGRLGASSRLRLFAYADALKSQGKDVEEVYNFFSDDYLQNFYRSGKKSFFAWISALFRRLRQIRSCRAKNLVIEYELFPFLPYQVEKFFLRGRKYLLDIDDWVWSKYRRNIFCRKKFDALISGACGVIAANDKIFERAAKLNSNCVKIPTTVDDSLLPKEKIAKSAKFTIAWIGTPTTYRQHLLPLGDTLRHLAEKIDYTLLIISALPLPEIPGVDCRFVKWEEQTQYRYLFGAHVGIMPLPACDEFASGKSAYKLIQYQVAGLPSVASAIGENCSVLENGVNGFLVSTPTQWLEALTKLHDDAALRAQMSDRAALAGEKYFLSANLDFYTAFLAKSSQS